MLTIANAPVSYGIFALARPDLVPLPTGDELLTHLSAAGYDGVDLGPHGLFGKGHELVANLQKHGLVLAGGWIDLPFSDTDEHFDAALEQTHEVLADFVLVAHAFPQCPPLPTIADSGNDLRRAHPAGGKQVELPLEQWRRLARRVDEVKQRIEDMGLTPTFHHHAATCVESPEEITRLLEDTSIDLTFDSGHLVFAGGDAVEDFKRWRSRINHLHLKDVNLAVLEEARGSADPVRDIWEKRVFTALGTGDLDIDRLMTEIVDSGWQGHVVIEQDVVLMSAEDVARAFTDQVANRRVIDRWIR